MAASTVCSECLGVGWTPYVVENLQGEEETAWELCPECKDES